MGKKVEKCDWDRHTFCVVPSWFESHDSDLALGAAEVLESMWLAGDEVGRSSRELWLLENLLPCLHLLTGEFLFSLLQYAKRGCQMVPCAPQGFLSSRIC